MANRDLYILPIPTLKNRHSALDYHQIKIDDSVTEFKEKLVDVSEYAIASYAAYSRPIAPYYRALAPQNKNVYVRETVALKLVQANKMLSSHDVELLALDGFRPIDLQKTIWNHFIQKGREALNKPNDKDLTQFAGQFCSDPRSFDRNNYRTWPVHITGGAIDVTLRSSTDQRELFMGSIFDDADHISGTRYFEDLGLHSQSAEEARRNRRLLYHSMTEAGFANYSHEWWHFDYGTQMWVMNGGHECEAFYGVSDLTVEDVT